MTDLTSTQQERLAALSSRQRDLLERLLAKQGLTVPEPAIARRPADLAHVPLSFEQERLWFMDLLLQHRQVFNVPVGLRLRGPLDPGALGQALSGVIARHEVLRTVFASLPDGPAQIILDPMACPLRVRDVSTAADPERAARAQAAAAIAEPFDLSAGPLVRADLFRLADDDHLLVICQHHIVSDYWSLGVFLSDLSALYAHARGTGPGLPPPGLQYADFACWQRDALSSERLRDHIGFWREALDGAPEVLELPADRPRPPVRTTLGRFHHVRFPAGLVAAASALARRESTTLHVVFLTAYIATLARHIRQDDIVVGVPVAGRTRSQLQQMVGYFLNWLPIRVYVADWPAFEVLLRRVRDASQQALARQDVPFEMLVQELRPTRAVGITPIFQTSFSLRDSAPAPPQLDGLRVSFGDLDGGATHYDLMAELWVEDGEVTGYFPFNDELFDELTVRRIVRRMTRILDAGTARPGTRLGDLPMLDPGDEAAALPDRPVTHPVTGTIHGEFWRVAATCPDRVAVTDGERTLTYRELADQAAALAHVLAERGAGPDRRVGVLLPRSADLVVALLAVLGSGAAYVPLDPDGPAGRNQQQVDDADCVALVTTAGLAGSLARPGLPVILLDADAAGLAGRPAPSPAAGQPPASLAYIIYTSGSTGHPKGVAVTHANVLRLFAAARADLDYGPDDVWTLFHATTFDFSVWELWGALLSGGKLVVVSRWVARASDAFADLLAEQRVTMLSQTPSAFSQLQAVLLANDRPLALRYVVFGGEALDPAALSDWFGRVGDTVTMVNMYGITETTVHVTFRPIGPADAAAAVSPVGRPLGDLAVYLLDRDLRPVPPNVPGEIFVGGAGVTRGYLGEPALTAARMVPDPFAGAPGSRMYRSGDLARRLAGGELLFLGREDDQVKIRGHRIEMGEVRQAVARLPEVTASAVVVSDTGNGKQLTAYVVIADGQPLPVNDARRRLREWLPDWMLPSSVVTIDAIPLTRNGKLDAAALPSPHARTAGGRLAVTPPVTPTQTRVAGIWQQLLGDGVAGIGQEDSFFELGGHSLLVVRLSSLLRETFGTEVVMAELFQYPTLAGMSDLIDRASREARNETELPSGDLVVAGMSDAEVEAMLRALAGDTPLAGETALAGETGPGGADGEPLAREP